MRWVHIIRPRWVVFEQVPPVLPIWHECARELEEAGYKTAVGLLRAEQYGAATARKRAILIARLDRQAKLPEATHSQFYNRSPSQRDLGVKDWISVAEALDLSPGGSIGMNRKKPSPRHLTADFRSTDIPSLCLTRFANAWHIRDQGDPVGRLVTPDELARIQSYPAGFPFAGATKTKIVQVANSVPPAMGEAILKEVISCEA